MPIYRRNQQPTSYRAAAIAPAVSAPATTPQPAVPRRRSTRSVKTKLTTPSSAATAPPTTEPPVVLSTAAPIRTIWGTPGEDDDDDDDEDGLLDSGRTTPTKHVTFATPVSAQLDAMLSLPLAKSKSVLPELEQTTVLSGIRPMFDTPTTKIVPGRFEDFVNDTPDEFFDANKPPYAPRVKDRLLNEARRWRAMEILDHYELESLPWWQFIETVAGMVDVRPETLANIESYNIGSSGIAPSRVTELPRAGGGAAPAVGTMGAADTSAAGFMSAPSTPARGRGRGGDGAPYLFSSAHATAATQQEPQRPRTLTLEDRIKRLLDEKAIDIPSTVLSTGRFKEEREELASLHTPEFLGGKAKTVSMSDEARMARRADRLDLVRALPYIEHPYRATGIVYINAAYAAALETAYADVQVYAGPDTTLRNVPMTEFMRRRSDNETGGDSASASVRTKFAQLVAYAMFMTKDFAHKGARFQHDKQAIIDASNGILHMLGQRFGYDRTRRCFYDVLPHNTEEQRPIYQQRRHASSLAAPSEFGGGFLTSTGRMTVYQAPLAMLRGRPY